MDKVSIVIPTHNRKNSIIQVLESYLHQQYLHEIIFIDDASDDGTYEYLQTQAERNTLIKIKRHEKIQGVSSSRNDGIDMATGTQRLIW